jgi:hypothetical protein
MKEEEERMTKNITNLLLCVALIVGCNGDGSDDCDLGDRGGTYLVSAIEIAGNCGPIETRLIYVGNTLDPGCELTAPDQVSEDQCTLARSIECVSGSQTARSSGVTQEHDGGDFLDGSLTLEIYEGADLVCTSTYNIAYERQ